MDEWPRGESLPHAAVGPTLERSMPDSLRCLYVCYLSLDDPLVHSQVVAYLEGLARSGHTVHLLTFDTPMSRGAVR